MPDSSESRDMTRLILLARKRLGFMAIKFDKDALLGAEDSHSMLMR